MQRGKETFALSLLSGVLFWLALPPCELTWLAWIAPMPWLLVIRRRELRTNESSQNPGRFAALVARPYLMIWVAALAFWLAALHWLTLPHWATVFGLIALAFYLAWYLPAFIALTRIAVHGLRVPLVVAAPVVWVGLEFLCSYLLSGFTMVLLGQTQYERTLLIQIVDVFGTYGLSFLVMLVAASITQALPFEDRRRSFWPLIPAAIAVTATLAYGKYRTSGEYTTAGPTVALIQGDIDTELKADASKNDQISAEYLRLTYRALRQSPRLDLIIWPETMFRYPWYTFADGYDAETPEGYTPTQLEAYSKLWLETLPRGVPMLIGIDNVHRADDGEERYNSALFIDRNGDVLGKYAKRHLVMFGEYVPFADRYPFLYRLTPLASGLVSGPKATAVEVNGVCYSPSICFETTLARVIRRLVNEARASQGCDPQVLVNLTNDGWFWGSAELDMHLVCGVFRAIECRKPLLIAANTGFSAWIDSDGRIIRQGKRRAEDVIIARPRLDSRRSVYLEFGDTLLAIPCFLVCCTVAVYGLLSRLKFVRPSAT